MVLFNYAILWSLLFIQQLEGFSQTKYDDFNDICNRIWREDRNRVTLGRHYRVNIQNRIYDTWSDTDRAYSPLFSYVDKDILNKPTYKAFLTLLDNYERFVGTTEDMTSTETRETWAFLNAISGTGPIKALHQYLVGKGIASTSMNNFLQELYKMWFYRYQRKSYRDSSGFEHVFVGEISWGKVSGFHNWLQLYQLEKTKKLDYRGFLNYYSSEPSRLKLQFYWGNYKKPVSSVFLGTSPEFEIAVYTLCIMVNPGKSCHCRMNGQNIPIATHRYEGSSNFLVASAYLNI